MNNDMHNDITDISLWIIVIQSLLHRCQDISLCSTTICYCFKSYM